MKVTQFIERIFSKYLPSPFTIAIILTLLTIALAIAVGDFQGDGPRVVQVLEYWEEGIWNTALLEFAYQMMLILVLGHILVLSKPMAGLLSRLTKFATNTSSAVVLVSVATMLVAFFNWGLGLIFGAILAKKIGEKSQIEGIPINYPLVGAAGYGGLMIWHGGISGSAPIKVAEDGHIKTLMDQVTSSEIISALPQNITFASTVFSPSNLIVFCTVLITVPIVLYRLSKSTKEKLLSPSLFSTIIQNKDNDEDVGRLDNSKLLGIGFGVIALITFTVKYWENLLDLQITPNMLNFFMLGLGIVLHGNFANFIRATTEAIKGASGILIQFPLYFGIMGIMKSSGMVVLISDFFVSIANSTTLPIFTFFSAGLVNIFVPSGGGQWAIQGPIVIESALKLGVPLPKAIMALAYGDQITNMIQPFWALPLLGITRLKAKEILPYTLIIMVVGIVAFILGLLLLY
ncbi:MAG: TIGR00366 family protein [Flavobacteriaceae bacterium]|nr:TIGR00366 family protein [Flavobacteriaceae bacterium]